MKTTRKVVGDGQRRRLTADESSKLEVRKNEIIRRIEEGTLRYDHVMFAFQAIIEAKSPVKVSSDKGTDLEFWDNFYAKYFNLPFSFSGIVIPPKPTEGNWRLLVIAKGLTNSQVYFACENQFPSREYFWRLEMDPTSERDPKNGTYAIWVRDVVEADFVHKNKSADMIAKEGLKTETLLERMIHELVYFWETGKHLDVSNNTLCSCSPRSDGRVPCAYWHGSWFEVNWNYTYYRCAGLRSREVVAVETSTEMIRVAHASPEARRLLEFFMNKT